MSRKKNPCSACGQLCTGGANQCRSCFIANKQTYEERYAKIKAWQKANPEKVKESQYRNRLKVKLECFEAYGGAVCACCGETELVFLALDHINGGGSQHRKELGALGEVLYRTLRREGFPPGYQVLCHNCNQAKHILGVCPHAIQHETPAGFYGSGVIPQKSGQVN